MDGLNEIDVVLLHVDGDAPGFADRCREMTGKYVPCQFRDLGEIRFVLRSIARHAPWARVVLAVQNDSHVPSWLARGTVRTVRHDQFIPADLLPTFNFSTIFAHLHRIPDLGERYIVWSDDVVLGADISQADFFDRDGLPRTGAGRYLVRDQRTAKASTYQLNLIAGMELLRRKTGTERAVIVYPHMPIGLTRELWRRHLEVFAQDPVYAQTISKRSRGDERARRAVDVKTVFANWLEICLRRRPEVLRYLSLARETATQMLWKVPFLRLPARPLFGKYAIVNDLQQTRRNMRRMLRERATYMNVNDDAYDSWAGPGSELTVNPASVTALHEALGALHPEPSRFETL